MPTAAKLVAALMFAAVGWLAANAHVPSLGENAAVGLFRELTALIGLIVGWRVMGRRAGHGYGEAMGAGLMTSVVVAFYALLLFGVYLMIQRAMSAQSYDGPMEAVLGVFEIMLEQVQKMATVGVLGALVVGGLLGGAATEWAGKRWR